MVVMREIMLFIGKPKGRSMMISNGCHALTKSDFEFGGIIEEP